MDSTQGKSDRSQDAWLPSLKQLRRNHSCLKKNKMVKLSNSCTLRNRGVRGRGVLLRLWLILLQRGRGTPVSLPPLWWQNSGTESARTFSLINPYHVLVLRPALCGLGSAPGQTAHAREPQTVQTQTGAKRAEWRTEGGRYGKSEIFLDALLPWRKSSLK